MMFDAAGNLLEVDDGGIYRRTNPRSNTGDWFSVIGNFQVTEQHDVAYDPISNIIISGNQDTGTMYQIAPGPLPGTASPRRTAATWPCRWTRSIRRSRSATPVIKTWAAFCVKSTMPATTWSAPTYPALSGFVGDAQFVTPVEINAVDPRRLIIGGSTRTYESFNQGDTLSVVRMIGVNSGDGDPIAYGGRSGGVDNPDVLYVGSGNNVYVRTTAAGTLAPSVAYAGGTPTDIVLDSDEWRTAYVTSANAVTMTPNAGLTWIDVTGNLSVLDDDFHSIVYVPGATDDMIFVGGRQSVYQMLVSRPGVWQEYGTGLPTVPVWDLDVHVGDDVLVAGTLGRGSWTASASGAGGGLDLVLTVNSPNPCLSEDGITGPATATTATVRRTGSTVGVLSVTILFDPTQVTVAGDTLGSATIVIPDGQAASAAFAVAAVNDRLTDGLQTVFLSPSAMGYNGVPDTVDVLDADADVKAEIEVVVSAASVSEPFGFTSMTITRSDTVGDVDVTVTSSDTSEAIPFGSGVYRISAGLATRPCSWRPKTTTWRTARRPRS